ncbi:putative RNA recognition motif domain, nucleotide-binding alpha-beta plait domain superfamily [Helianthus anomalus]
MKEFQVRLIADKETNKPRGYAFIEYMHTRDMKAAYKQADGRKLDNRRVLVDVERGRTVPNWRPRRLGGGLGTSRVGGEEVNQKNSGREQQQSGGATRSVEPRAQEERQHREKSRERVKEREREKSRERSHDRPRDREHREDRHHRDRDRKSDRGDRDRDRSGRDRDRHRDRDRSGRDRDRSGRDRDRDHHREKDREGDVEHIDRDRGRSRDKEYEYERVDRHERDKHEDRQKSYDHGDEEEWYDQPEHGGDKRVDPERDLGGYDYYDQERYNHQDHDHDHDHDRYGQMEEDNYEGGKLDTRDKDRDGEYRRSDRSLSREYEY